MTGPRVIAAASGARPRPGSFFSASRKADRIGLTLKYRVERLPVLDHEAAPLASRTSESRRASRPSS